MIQSLVVSYVSVKLAAGHGAVVFVCTNPDYTQNDTPDHIRPVFRGSVDDCE